MSSPRMNRSSTYPGSGNRGRSAARVWPHAEGAISRCCLARHSRTDQVHSLVGPAHMRGACGPWSEEPSPLLLASFILPASTERKIRSRSRGCRAGLTEQPELRPVPLYPSPSCRDPASCVTLRTDSRGAISSTPAPMAMEAPCGASQTGQCMNNPVAIPSR